MTADLKFGWRQSAASDIDIHLCDPHRMLLSAAEIGARRLRMARDKKPAPRWQHHRIRVS
jgi:hypothetical protein